MNSPYVTVALPLNQLYAGKNLNFDVEVLHDAGPVDLTGAVLTLRLTQGGTQRLLLTTPDATSQLVITDPVAGKLTVNLAGETSGTWRGSLDATLDVVLQNGFDARLIAGVWTYRA